MLSDDVPKPNIQNDPGIEATKGAPAPMARSDSSTSTPEPVRRPWGWALAAGLLAGLLTTLGGEMVWPGVRAAQTPKIVPYPTAEDRARIIDGQVRSTGVSFLQQGAILGAILGLAGGFARRSARSGLVAAAAGLALGAAAAAGAAYGLLPVYFRNIDPQGHALALPLLTHGGIWAATGAAAGLAFGLGLAGRGGWARGALGGLLGGVAATMVYDLVGALAFPLDKTSQPVSATLISRFFAQLTVAVLVAASAALGAGDAPRRAPPAP
jgi:hypothetical protein